MLKTPCEIIQWDVLPALRRELVSNILKQNIARKDIAQLFDMSEAAICQYIKSKRGQQFKFSKDIKILIKESAVRIAESKKKETVIYEICNICSELKQQKVICQLHHRENPCLVECGLHKSCRGVC